MFSVNMWLKLNNKNKVKQQLVMENVPTIRFPKFGLYILKLFFEQN
jgi:hypothetical protein